MHDNSLAAYANINLAEKERETLELLAAHGPACQAELVQALCGQEAFQAMSDAARTKVAQSLYGRLHGLKKHGYAVVVGTKPDPITGNTVDIYAINESPVQHETVARKGPSLKKVLASIEDLEERLTGLGDVPVSAAALVKMLKHLRES